MAADGNGATGARAPPLARRASSHTVKLGRDGLVTRSALELMDGETPLIDVASKLAVQGVPVGTVTLARFVVQAVLMAPVVILMGY